MTSRVSSTRVYEGVRARPTTGGLVAALVGLVTFGCAQPSTRQDASVDATVAALDAPAPVADAAIEDTFSLPSDGGPPDAAILTSCPPPPCAADLDCAACPGSASQARCCNLVTGFCFLSATPTCPPPVLPVDSGVNCVAHCTTDAECGASCPFVGVSWTCLGGSCLAF